MYILGMQVPWINTWITFVARARGNQGGVCSIMHGATVVNVHQHDGLQQFASMTLVLLGVQRNRRRGIWPRTAVRYHW